MINNNLYTLIGCLESIALLVSYLICVYIDNKVDFNKEKKEDEIKRR